MADRNRLMMWPSDDGSADDAENYFDFGLWDKTSQPLVRRGTLLPFGEYEDGSIAPAWPAALADPYEAAVRGLEGPDAVRPEDALIAAGGAALGGIPFAAKGAVGSAGGRLMHGADLPPAAVNALTDNAPTGIRAYHGSPHHFDRFSLDKIGTGEGAQAYGHGLYFAESEDVAKSYRDALSRQISYDGSSVANMHPSDSPKATAIHSISTLVADGKDAKSAIAEEATKWRASADPYFEFAKANPQHADRARQQAQKFLDIAKEIENLDASQFSKNPGRMYEVNIKADPEQFLDWDLPLSQQSEAVRRALQDRGAYRDDWTGAQAYESSKLVPGDFRDKAAATQALREAGIPGIRYLDQGSRAAGEGSRNYVVFDDNLIDILRKYANAPTGAPFALAGDEFDRPRNRLMDAILRGEEIY